MQKEIKRFNTTNNSNNDTSKTNIKTKKEKRTRSKIYWSEREEKTLFILQMALGSKFSIIRAFIKDKEVNDIKNHFYSKLRTYLSLQLSKLNKENFFKEIDSNAYNIKKVLSLVLSNKIPTMILNKNIIKELILNEEEKNKNKKNEIIIDEKNEDKKDKKIIGKKRGRPSKKNKINKENNNNLKIKGIEKEKEINEKKDDKNNSTEENI